MEPICDDLYAYLRLKICMSRGEKLTCHMSRLAQPRRFNTFQFEDIFTKLLKKHLHWLPPAALASLEMEFRLSRLQI